MLPEEWPAITPVNFFQLAFDCDPLEGAREFPSLDVSQKRYLFPSTAMLCEEERFADFFMGWSPEGIEVLAHVQVPFKVVSYPAISRGDSLELFFDTRDLKSSGYNSRFCHHFFFLPEAVEGVVAQEITRFRLEETHELCDPKELKVKTRFAEKGYELHVFIPSHCLYGYDPVQMNRIGFTYRMNRAVGPPQHLSVMSQDYPIEQQPSLWSSVTFRTKGKQ